jgi:hypothetical protein
MIIQLERPDKKLDMQTAQQILEGAGIELDLNYGPILVNFPLGRYVVRGRVSTAAREKAEKIPGVTFFVDVQEEAI